MVIISGKRNSSKKISASKTGFMSLIHDDVKCVFERDPAARTRMEVLTTYPGVHAIIVFRIANSLWKKNWKYSARLLSYLARIWTTIDIHPGATIGRRFFIDHGSGVVIGETAEVGNDVTLYHGVTLGGVSWSKGKRHPTLEDGVVVGAGAKILGPITIGAGAKVGANSVVVKDVPPDSVVVGVPGRTRSRNASLAPEPEHEDLQHDRLPDPTMELLRDLSERVNTLEGTLQVWERNDGRPTSEALAKQWVSSGSHI